MLALNLAFPDVVGPRPQEFARVLPSFSSSFDKQLDLTNCLLYLALVLLSFQKWSAS